MYSVPMALADFIPVLLFGAAAMILQRDLYNKMTKGMFALFCTGTINVFLAGFLKAVYKLLFAAGVCDFQRLNHLFFPLQAIGFLLAGMGLACLHARERKKERLLSVAAPAVFSGTFLFVALMILGLLGMDLSLAAFAKKLKKPLAAALFLVSFVFCLAMGYLSSRDFTQASMNWIAEGVNILGQGSLLAGVRMLDRAGLQAYNAAEKAE